MANEGKYLNLKPHVPSWSIYNVNGPYVTSSRIGTLAPSQFGGLSYQILEDKGNDVYIIQTENFGRIAIWAGDSDSTFTNSPSYKSGGSLPTGSSGNYLNLKPHVPSWSIYYVNGPYVPAERIGTLAPSQFGGLSYLILEEKGNDLYLIQTESFGRVAIWAGDSDSTFSSTPLYTDIVNGGGSEFDSTGGTGQYVNLHAHVPTWTVYPPQEPYTLQYGIGKLAPAQYSGLSYAILGNPLADVYLIQTESFGKVAIWAGDSDSTFTSYPLYGNHSSPTVPGIDLGGISFPDSVGIVPRETWGAQAIDFSHMDGSLPAKRYIVIHHEAGTQPQIGTDFEKMRAIQNYHRNDPDLLWGDIGYHYGIGQQGTVMEGRPIGYAGAHVGRPHNFDSIGICLFGNFMYASPTEKQMAKLVPLLVQLCKNYGISSDNILGHRDMDSNYGYTSCPGDYFYSGTNNLQDIRDAVKNKLLEKTPISFEWMKKGFSILKSIELPELKTEMEKEVLTYSK